MPKRKKETYFAKRNEDSDSDLVPLLPQSDDLLGVMGALFGLIRGRHSRESDEPLRPENDENTFSDCDLFVQTLKDSSDSMSRGLSEIYSDYFLESNKLHRETIDKLTELRITFLEDVKKEMKRIQRN